MSKTAYIFRCGSRWSLVWTDNEHHQSSTPLSADMAPAHTAFKGSTGSEAILRLARHPGGARYASLIDVAEVHEMSEAAVKAARKNGLRLERAARVLQSNLVAG